jgi:outer membrane protein assembly factor BamB
VRLVSHRPDVGGIVGWSVSARKPAWEAKERWPVLGGTLTSDSGLVFYGTLDGMVKALDGRSGKLLWQHKGPAGVVSRPMIFRGSDGRQRVAVVAGTGRLFGLSRVEALDPRDDGAGFGLAGLLRQFPRDEDASGTLLVFRLP